VSSSVSGLSTRQIDRLAALQLAPRNSRVEAGRDRGEAVAPLSPSPVVGQRSAALGDELLATFLTDGSGRSEPAGRPAAPRDGLAPLLARASGWRLNDGAPEAALPGGIDAPAGAFGNHPPPLPGGASPPPSEALTGGTPGARGSLEPSGRDAAESAAAQRRQQADALQAALAAYAAGRPTQPASLALET
jgi:hypothetical protein